MLSARHRLIAGALLAALAGGWLPAVTAGHGGGCDHGCSRGACTCAIEGHGHASRPAASGAAPKGAHCARVPAATPAPASETTEPAAGEGCLWRDAPDSSRLPIDRVVGQTDPSHRALLPFAERLRVLQFGGRCAEAAAADESSSPPRPPIPPPRSQRWA